MESDLQMEYESVLCLKDKSGKLVAFFRNDITNRAVKLYGAQELSLDEISSLFKSFNLASMPQMNDNTGKTTEEEQGGN